MKVRLEGEQEIRVLLTTPDLEVESAAEGVGFSPLHMLAASLATCTASVLMSWAMQAELGFDDLELGVTWDYVEDPYRVGRFDLSIEWPSLPASRREAAVRAAHHCTVENTLKHPTEVVIEA